MGAGNGESEIPLLLTLFYLFRESGAGGVTHGYIKEHLEGDGILLDKRWKIYTSILKRFDADYYFHFK